MHGRGVESRWLGQRDHLFSHINACFSLSGWKCDFKSNLRCALVQFWNHAYETGSWSLWVSAPCSSIGVVSKWICWLGAVITRLKFDPVPHHDYLFLYFRVGNMRNFIFWHFVIINTKKGQKSIIRQYAIEQKSRTLQCLASWILWHIDTLDISVLQRADLENSCRKLPSFTWYIEERLKIDWDYYELNCFCSLQVSKVRGPFY